MLRGVDLEVAAGSVVAVTGPSGSGKTTLLRLIKGDEALDAGAIWVAGQVMADDRIDLGTERRPVAAVPQGGGLRDERNVGANIALGLPRRIRSRLEGAARVAEMFDLVGLDTPLADRFPPQLSVSERQRVALARALVARPAVLLLDEPFYAFDPTTQARFRTELRHVLQQHTMATVLVSHHESDVAELADRHHRLVDGRLTPAR